MGSQNRPLSELMAERKAHAAYVAAKRQHHQGCTL